MFVFPRRLDQLSRFHRWVDLALLFKKGVGREIAVLEVADNVFSNVQHSRNPVLKFCGRRTAGDVSQSTILRPELFPGGSVFAAWKRTVHCYNFVVLDGESYGCGRLTSRSFSATCWPVWLPRKTMSPSKRIKSSSPPQQSSHTALVAKPRWSVRRKGDWNSEIAKLKAKYSTLLLLLFAGTIFANFCDLEKIAKLSTRKNFYQHIRHVI